LLAALALLAAGAGVVMTSAPATAAGSKCVALVVDFSHVGGSVSSACVTVGTNASGSDVLIAGHHKVTFDPRYGNDFVCAIDGIPAGGCHATDNTHDWVYYHRVPGGSAWHLSQEGAGTYKPANASTEGWVYDNGDSPAPAPRDVPYSSICKTAPKTATPTPTATPTSSKPAAVASPAARPARVVATPAGRHRPSAAASTPTASTPVRTTASPLAAVAPRHGHVVHHVPWALVVGLVALGALGAAAAVRLRRTDRTRP
jgi:hypothetical protein